MSRPEPTHTKTEVQKFQERIRKLENPIQEDIRVVKLTRQAKQADAKPSYVVKVNPKKVWLAGNEKYYSKVMKKVRDETQSVDFSEEPGVISAEYKHLYPPDFDGPVYHLQNQTVEDWREWKRSEQR